MPLHSYTKCCKVSVCSSSKARLRSNVWFRWITAPSFQSREKGFDGLPPDRHLISLRSLAILWFIVNGRSDVTGLNSLSFAFSVVKNHSLVSTPIQGITGTQINSFLLNWFRGTWLGLASTTDKMCAMVLRTKRFSPTLREANKLKPVHAKTL